MLQIRSFFVLMSSVLLLSLAGCSGVEKKTEYPKTPQERKEERMGKFGGDGLFAWTFGKPSQRAGAGIGVNGYLWQASLDFVHMMPIESIDPHAGVIMTNWHSVDGNSDSRYKLNIFITSDRLVADGLRVASFKQKRIEGKWKDVAPSEQFNREVEEKILYTARNFKVRSLN